MYQDVFIQFMRRVQAVRVNESRWLTPFYSFYTNKCV